jgi:hypothetical protein
LVLSIFQLQNIKSSLSQELTIIKSSILWRITPCILFKIGLEHGVLSQETELFIATVVRNSSLR